jgi:hypothetical protein
LQVGFGWSLSQSLFLGRFPIWLSTTTSVLASVFFCVVKLSNSSCADTGVSSVSEEWGGEVVIAVGKGVGDSFKSIFFIFFSYVPCVEGDHAKDECAGAKLDKIVPARDQFPIGVDDVLDVLL